MKSINKDHIIALLLFFISFTVFSQKKAVLASQYILVTKSYKSDKKFTVKNVSNAKIGVIFSHAPKDTTYLRPKESKDFKYKKVPISSEIYVHLSTEIWELVLSELIKTYKAKAKSYGIRNTIDDAWIEYTKSGVGTSSRAEQRKREAGNKLVKNAREQHLQDILDGMQYFKDLYDASHSLNNKRLIPVSVKTYLGLYYQHLK